jgi:hypothetical protein
MDNIYFLKMIIMNNIKINYFVDALMLIAGLLCGLTGIMKLDLILSFKVYQLIDYKMLSIIHDWSGVVLVLLIIVHLILHLNWIKQITKNIFFNKGEEVK